VDISTAKSIHNSQCFAIYKGTEMVAFRRVVTDYATFANLADVAVWPEYRGQGVSKKTYAQSRT
jgi:GNAT superfamily N-acetyltransferase